MPDERTAYRVETPVLVSYETRNDPAATPAHQLELWRALHCLQLCRGLFWAVRHLGVMAEHSPRVYTPEHLAETLESLGGLGEALAEAAGEQAQRLARLAEAAGEGGGR